MSVVDLHYRRLGPPGATPVVILHGLFGSSDNLGTIARELAEPSGKGLPAFDVLAVDLRDHGRSPHTDGIDYPRMAADVHALITKLRMERFVLVGHSMGGKTAMEFAQRWPELLKSLVVIDISPKAHANNQGDIVSALRSADLAPGRTRKQVEAQVTELVKEPGVVQFLLKSLYWLNEGQLAWRMNVELLERDMKNILAAVGPGIVRVPTVFIRGGQSNYISGTDLPAIKEQFPNSRVETIAQAGHWVHAQAPGEVVRLIREAAE